jgi:hypothetical protein
MAPPPAREPLSKDEREALISPATEPFGPLICELRRLDNGIRVLAEQAARLVALYRRIWESYATKHAESSPREGKRTLA